MFPIYPNCTLWKAVKIYLLGEMSLFSTLPPPLPLLSLPFFAIAIFYIIFGLECSEWKDFREKLVLRDKSTQHEFLLTVSQSRIQNYLFFSKSVME